MNPKLIRRQERRGLRLWNVGLVLALAFVAALAVAAGVFFAGWDLLGARGLKTQRRIDASTLFDLVKLAFGVVAGAGALVALVVAYRRQRVDEDGALREATRLHTERFTTAVSQLGEESAAVRLGGVHALAGLADDAPTRDLRQTCIDVLCAYLRLPYTAEADLPADDAEARNAYRALQEVRHTVVRLIRDHLRLPSDHPHCWRGHDLDFTGAQFSGGLVDFTGAHFSGRVAFTGAQFSGCTVDFIGAEFSHSVMDFEGAQFSGGRIDFTASVFSGGMVVFTDSALSVNRVCFSGAAFSNSSQLAFRNTAFSGCRVDFIGAHFFRYGYVAFDSAEFSDSTVDIGGADFFGGLVSLSGAGGATLIGVPEPLPDGLSMPPRWLRPAP